MKLLILLVLVSSLSQSAWADPKIIYGEDNRVDFFELTNPLFIKLSQSTAALVNKRKLESRGSYYQVPFLETLSKDHNICFDQKFSTQPLLPHCSGFLVGDDIMVSAGHCYDSQTDCAKSVWVFDYKINQASQRHIDNIDKDNVYSCKKVIKQIWADGQDFAVIQLDRKVKGRSPLKYRTRGKISNTANLVVIGFPSKLPMKISDAGEILLNDNPYQFTTNLDTFQGNSGSAVFDSKTGVLEGILVSGKTDYVNSRPWDKNSCMIVNECDERGLNCIGTDRLTLEVPGENVTRITTLSQYFKI